MSGHWKAPSSTASRVTVKEGAVCVSTGSERPAKRRTQRGKEIRSCTTDRASLPCWTWSDRRKTKPQSLRSPASPRRTGWPASGSLPLGSSTTKPKIGITVSNRQQLNPKESVCMPLSQKHNVALDLRLSPNAARAVALQNATRIGVQNGHSAQEILDNARTFTSYIENGEDG